MRFPSILARCVALSSILVMLATPSFGGWIVDGVVVCDAVETQGFPRVVCDGSSAFVIWKDSRRGIGTQDLYAQRFDMNGNALWAADGVPVCVGAATHHQVILDGNGGIIVAWTDTRTGSFALEIYAQRLNSAGTPQWTVNGNAVCVLANEQRYPQLVSDGAGGAIIVWEDYRNNATLSADIFGQRMNSAGTALWINNGIPICAMPAPQIEPHVARNLTAGGAIVTWRDDRTFADTSSDIYASYLTLTGTMPWTANGVVVCNHAVGQSRPDIVSDGANGAIIAWEDARNFTSGASIFALRIDGAGAAQWSVNGVFVVDAPGVQIQPRMTMDGSGGAVIAWYDARTAPASTYAQRVDFLSGSAQWAANGVPVVSQKSDQESLVMSGDGTGGAVFAWHDLRNGWYDVFAQKVDGVAGAQQWGANGITLIDEATTQMSPAVAYDGAGGAVVVWEDARNHASTGFDLYAQRVTSDGQIPTSVGGRTPAGGLTLGANFPNPFSSTTTMRIELATQSHVVLEVFDVRGARVSRFDAGVRTPGAHDLRFDGRDDHNRALPSGVYFCRVTANGETRSRKLVIQR